MKFELTRVSKDAIPRFEIEISYCHGNDFHFTYQTTTINSKDLKDLEAYITMFNELRDMVEANRTDDVPYPDEYMEDFKDYLSTFDVDGLDDVSITLVNDETDESYDFFARMAIRKIVYYDEHGVKFDVKQTD